MQDKNKREIANELKKIYNAVSPFIEKHTALICAPGKKVRPASLSFPHVHSGIKDSFAVPDLMESLPLH